MKMLNPKPIILVIILLTAGISSTIRDALAMPQSKADDLSNSTAATPEAKQGDNRPTKSSQPTSREAARVASEAKQSVKPVNIDSLDELKRVGSPVTSKAGTSPERTKGQYHEIPGLYVVEGRVPDCGEKAADHLDCGWYEFHMYRSFPKEVFRVCEEKPHVRVIAKLYWRDPLVYRRLPEERLVQREGIEHKEGEKVAGEFQLRPIRVWVEVSYPR